MAIINHLNPQKKWSLLFGLSADPIHKGHEQVIINSINFLHKKGFEIDSFLLIPVYRPNLIAGKKKPLSEYADRLSMCKLACERLSKQLSQDIHVSEIEKKLHYQTANKSYSVNTVKALNIKNSLFIASADHFSGRWPKFRKWYKWQELLKFSGLLINQRPEHKLNTNYIEKLKELNPNIFIVRDEKTINISSTILRNHFKKQGSITDINSYISNDVLSYIKKQELYSK